MKLRYDFNTSEKTYRTFPQKVVQSTGLLDRWSFLKWCCPFCLEKPRPQSRKSSVPVIRITRPRSPDSDLESDEDDEKEEEEEEAARRRGSAGSSGSLTRSSKGAPTNSSGGGGREDVASLESSLGSGELDIINEEMDEAKDYDSESIESKESIRSHKGSSHSCKSSSSAAVKDKTSGKSKSSWRGKDKGSSGDSRESRKNSKESLKGSRDSVKDKDSQNEKTKSPMKKLIKHLKRTASTPAPMGRSGDKRNNASTRSTTSLEEGGGKGGGGRFGSKKFSFTPSSGEWRTRSATVDNRVKMVGKDSKVENYRSATGEVIGRGVVLAKSTNVVKSATLDGKGSSGREISMCDGKDNKEEEEAIRSTATWERRVNNAKTGNSHPETKGDAKMKGKRDGRIFSQPTDMMEKGTVIGEDAEPLLPPPPPPPPLPPFVEKVVLAEEDNAEVVFKSPKKSLRKDSGRETGSEIGVGETEGRTDEGGEEVEDDEERGKGKRGKDAKGRGGQHYNDDDEGAEGVGETTESSPPETPATKERTYDSSSTKPSSGFEDESTGSLEEGLVQKSGSPSPLVGSVGRISGRESVASLASSTDNSTVTHPDEDIERLMQISEKKRNSLTPLGSRSESMASVCSAGAEGRYGTVIIKGEIELGLQYNYKEGQLECHVVQCRELAAVDSKRNRSDPYVKVYLLPDKSKSGKRKTKVKKHTLNPIFEEVLRFSTTMSDLDSRTLWISVWHSDMFGRNDFLGEVIIALADTVFDDVTPKWYPLQDRTEPMEDMSYSPRGDLIMALKFVPPDAVGSRKARRSRGALHVLVKEAKSLAAARPHGTADPICKGLLLPEKGKASKQKTSVCRKTLNPTWNHTLVFDDTSLQELTERALELSVWDHDRLGTSQFLGGCRLSLGKGKHGGRPVEWMEAAGMEVKLWEQMLERPNLWVEGSIMLRPTMDKPIYSSSMTE